MNGITRAMFALGHVDNASDLNKPISSAIETAISLKANTHDMTEPCIGLGKVYKIIDSNKPVPTQNALNLKQDALILGDPSDGFRYYRARMALEL